MTPIPSRYIHERRTQASYQPGSACSFSRIERLSRTYRCNARILDPDLLLERDASSLLRVGAHTAKNTVSKYSWSISGFVIGTLSPSKVLDTRRTRSFSLSLSPRCILLATRVSPARTSVGQRDIPAINPVEGINHRRIGVEREGWPGGSG